MHITILASQKYDRRKSYTFECVFPHFEEVMAKKQSIYYFIGNYFPWVGVGSRFSDIFRGGGGVADLLLLLLIYC